MRYLKKVLFYIFLLLSLPTGVMAQDAMFSQTYASPMYLSPSFTGLTDGSRITLNYRDQWPGIPGTYRTMAFAADHFFSDYSSGVGIMFVRDDQGSGQLVKQNIGILYAYEFEVTQGVFVRPGIQFKYAEQKIDPTSIISPEDLNPDDGTVMPRGRSYIITDSYKRFDASASAMIYSDLFWAGISVDNLIKKDIGFTDIETYTPVKTTIYGGYKIRYRERGLRYKHDEQSISLTANYFMQDKFRQLSIGAYWYINPLEIGLWYRGIPFATSKKLSNNDAIVMILGVSFGNIRFSYSYDYTLSDLAGSSNGANEFSIMFKFNRRYKKNMYRSVIPERFGDTYRSGGSKYKRRSHKIF